MHSAGNLPSYASFVAPSAGAPLRRCVNLLLRLLVKWRTGLRIDVARLRARQSRLDRRLGRDLPGVARAQARDVDAQSGAPFDQQP
jgi:heme exporter protein D